MALAGGSLLLSLAPTLLSGGIGILRDLLQNKVKQEEK